MSTLKTLEIPGYQVMQYLGSGARSWRRAFVAKLPFSLQRLVASRQKGAFWAGGAACRGSADRFSVIDQQVFNLQEIFSGAATRPLKVAIGIGEHALRHPIEEFFAPLGQHR